MQASLGPMASNDQEIRNASSEDWRLQAADKGVAWMVGHRAAILRYAYIAQLAVGLFLLLFGYAIGREHLHLIRAGVRTTGTIVDYKEEHWSTTPGHARWVVAFMPVVQFQSADRTIRFKDWMGSKAVIRNVPVVVLYDPENPSLAMIDRPVWNWVPWAPTMGVGFFLLLVGTRAFLRSRLRT